MMQCAHLGALLGAPEPHLEAREAHFGAHLGTPGAHLGVHLGAHLETPGAHGAHLGAHGAKCTHAKAHVTTILAPPSTPPLPQKENMVFYHPFTMRISGPQVFIYIILIFYHILKHN
jgi:hypothetical protein